MSIRILNGGTPTPFPGALNAPSNVVASNPTSTSIDLAWTAPTQGLATEYRVRDNSDDSLVKTVTWPSTGTTISGLTPETAYVFYVVTSDGVTESPKSNTATETTTAAGPAPTGIYVDKTVAASTLYDPATRTIGSGSEQCYQTIQESVNNIGIGGAIYVRGAVGGGTETYLENVLFGSNVVNGETGAWNSIQSYPGEWAEIDGQNNAEYTLGNVRGGAGAAATNAKKYWIIERLGITGGTTGGSTGGAGIYIHHGPFIIRYCHIHDNMAVTQDDNPGGIVGYSWEDCVIEYNNLINNGALDNGANTAHVAVFSDFLYVETAQNGYTFPASVPPCARNIIRYNYMDGSAYGFKHKGRQHFTGRTIGGDPSIDYVDTYDTFGDKIHHNYFTGQARAPISCMQDFTQIYNNISEGGVYAFLQCPEDYYNGMYKVVTYNNTCVNMPNRAISRFHCDRYPPLNPEYHGWDLNNLIDNSSFKTGWGRYTGVDINIAPICNGDGFTSPDFTNYVGSNNYHYRSGDSDHYRIGSTFYTQAEYEAQSLTASPKVVYENAFDAGNLLFVDTVGSDRYVTNGAHAIEAGVTVADGGVGGAHPYLVGITIPSYVGAANPSSNAWVSGVYTSITDVDYLKAQAIGSIPTWVE